MIRDNIHKIRLISLLFCSLGRHDYEFVYPHPKGHILMCFYCDHKKLVLGGKGH